ncbi:class I adenylate-forming enzyme family protein [Pseudomonas fragi]|uniref:class I adenylate-forming enzyme family protein n=1 Tax=Pseudomonas fragi TaxID=296 RepID=UPI002004AA8E|nr:class I adenylate-forming enzyme family protein [Pseudomonas fragi]MCK6253123.1 acyl--CoA ligase [Pseudomonas fragi]
MKLEQWQSAWQQLIGAGSPFEVQTPADGGPKYFRHTAASVWAAIDSGRIHGDREFLVWEQQRLTFSQFFDQVDRLAGQLVERFGIRKGDRVAIAMRNQPAWLVAFAAIQRCAGVCVPLNSWGLRDELFHGLQDSGASLLLSDEPRLQLLANDLREQGLATIVVGLRAGAPLEEHCQCLEDLLAAPAINVPAQAVSASDPAMILYTSGTTSLAKGVLSTHGAVCQALVALEFQGAFCAVSSPERISVVINSGYAPATLMAVPLFHVSGLHAQFLLALRSGRRLLLMYKWDVEKALDLIRDEQCTQFNGAPVMMQQLLASPRFGSSDTASLFGLGLGGAAPSSSLLDNLTRRKPEAIGGSGYGLTESNGICAAHGGDQFAYKPASAGWPLPIVDVRIGDSPDRPVPAGVSGLIWVRSPTLMSEYWNLPEASARTLCDGWLDTGDIGLLDDEGFLYITDRAKDLINRGGEKIAAAEVESCACEMPGVIEAAAFAVPDAVLGEVVFLVVRGEPGAIPGSEAVRSFIAQRLASYKVPAQIHVQHTPFARNASGKTLKSVLKETLVTA